MDLISLLRTLTAPTGVTGREDVAAKVAVELLQPLTDNVSVDSRGSVVATVNGVGPKILLDAHMDQVGFIVTGIAEDGFVKFDKCGGTDERILSGLEVIILGEGPVYGVVSSLPPHLMDAEDEGKVKEEKDLSIDTGLTTEECKALIHLGDRIVPKFRFMQLLGTQVTSAALDDRAGMAVHIRALELIREQVEKGAAMPNLCIQFTVQEETGGSAASTAAFKAEPDMAIAVDVSFAFTPGCTKEDCGKIGEGPMLGIAPVLDHSISQAFKAIAQAKKIPLQYEVMTRRTGTHADEIAVTRSGVPTALISVPLKYMHTPIEVVDTEDIERSAQLIAEFALAIAAKAEGGKD